MKQPVILTLAAGTMAAIVLTGCGLGVEKTVTVPSSGDGGEPGESRTEYIAVDGTKATIETGKDGSVNWSATGPEGSSDSFSSTNRWELSEIDGSLLYPNAKVADHEGARTKIQTGSETQYAVELTTQDEPSKVAIFYKARLKGADSLSQPGSELVSGKDDGGTEVLVTAMRRPGDSTTTIALMVRKKKG
jgi:hypothetical protein